MIPDRITLSWPEPSFRVNFNSLFDLGTSSHFNTFTTLKSDLEKVSKSISSSNRGSTFTLDRSIFTSFFSASSSASDEPSLKGFIVAERLKVAISFGDLSENAEYDEAKKEQAALEERILKLENMTRVAVIIDESNVNLDIITIGSIVKIYDEDFDEELEYTIVGSAEADPYDGKISNESPVGKALLGRAKGDVVEVTVPDGIAKLKVVDIKR